jgi:hypothetical protein
MCRWVALAGASDAAVVDRREAEINTVLVAKHAFGQGPYAVGEWRGAEVAQQIDTDGISVGSATLVDRSGPFATSGGVSLARPRCNRVVVDCELQALLGGGQGGLS